MSRHKPKHILVSTITPFASPLDREESYSPVYRRPKHDKSALPWPEKQQHVQIASQSGHAIETSSKISTVNIQEILQHLRNGNIKDVERVILKMEHEIQQKDHELALQDKRLELMEEQLAAALSEVRLSKTQCPHRVGHDRDIMAENEQCHQMVTELRAQITRLNQELDAWNGSTAANRQRDLHCCECAGIFGISANVKSKQKSSIYFD